MGTTYHLKARYADFVKDLLLDQNVIENEVSLILSGFLLISDGR